MLKRKIATSVLIALTSVAGFSLVSGCASTAQQESTGQYIDSSAITTKVKAQLLADKSIRSLPITVNTYKNTVQLSGFVNSLAQKRKAGEIASNVKGVHKVQNFISVK